MTELTTEQREQFDRRRAGFDAFFNELMPGLMQRLLNVIRVCYASVKRMRSIFLSPLPRIARVKRDPSEFAFAASDLGERVG